MPHFPPPPTMPARRRNDRFVSTLATLAAAFVFGGEVMGALGFW